jgi:(R,R)-butanediol dehydrogenase/meso-butanediol dehydrogenase/diacetyl reductase/L-iditol 2-dehydrogenase
MHSRDLTIRDVRSSPYAFPKALQVLPKLNLQPMIKVYPLNDVIQAFEAQKTGKNVKIMLKM